MEEINLSDVTWEGCSECGGRLAYNALLTLQAYTEDEEREEIIPTYLVHKYLVYMCVKCGCPVRLTYQQLEEVERKKLAYLRFKVKRMQAEEVFGGEGHNPNYAKLALKFKNFKEDYDKRMLIATENKKRSNVP